MARSAAQVANSAPAEIPTDRRLLLAAEQLFAERGIDAVSLRTIMAAAGANTASVHYHYGSKDGLVKALIAERSGRISHRRAELLDALDSETLHVRRLAEAFVEPVAEMVADGDTAWVSFIAGVVSSNHPALSLVVEGFEPQAIQFINLLGRLYPDAAPQTIRFRLTQAMSLTFQVLGNLDGVTGLVAISGPTLTLDDVRAELIDTVTAILAGPPDR